MAALTDFNAYKTRLAAPRQVAPLCFVTPTMTAGRMYDSWLVANGPNVGVAPTTSVVPTNTTAGSLGQLDAIAEELFVLGNTLGGSSGMAILCDRLAHNGGMSGLTAATEDTTNLPSAALTRYTTGEGVYAGVSIYTAIGSTATTGRMTYVNQAGTTGRVGPLMVFGGTQYREVNRFMHIPLVSGDTGVRSVTSFYATASTGTAGNFGIVLYKPLMAFCLHKTLGDQTFNFIDGGMIGGLPVIQDGACLFWLLVSSSSSFNLVGAIPLSTV